MNAPRLCNATAVAVATATASATPKPMKGAFQSVVTGRCLARVLLYFGLWSVAVAEISDYLANCRPGAAEFLVREASRPGFQNHT